MSVPRLFPDYAAAPTPRERAAARAEAERCQGSLFSVPDDRLPVHACPVCAGDHAGPCAGGEAVTLWA